jgi:hypothetical protein
MTTPPTLNIDMKVKVNHMFSTPLVVGKFEGSEALAREIAAIVRDRRDTHPGVIQTNVGGWHSTYDMTDWAGQPARNLANLAIGLAKNSSAFSDGSPDDYDWTVQMWANISGHGASNSVHVHPGSLWAAVFYVDLGQETPGEDVGGRLHFEDPRHPLPSMRHESFRLTDASGAQYNGALTINSAVGDLVLFPSWLKHGVSTYTGSGERISVAMNLNALVPARPRPAKSANRLAAVERPEVLQ